MKTVTDILDAKGRDVWSVHPDATMYEALQQMADRNEGALPVLLGNQVAGIVSERDDARKIILHGKTSGETRVRELMTEKALYVQASNRVEECMTLMTAERVQHLPVLKGERVAGLLSIGDTVKAVPSDREPVIDQLRRHIEGRH